MSLCHIYVSRRCLSCHGVMYLCVTSLMSRLCLLGYCVMCLCVTSMCHDCVSHVTVSCISVSHLLCHDCVSYVTVSRVSMSHLSMSRLCILCHIMSVYVMFLYASIVSSYVMRYVLLPISHICRLGTHNTQLLCSECLGSFHGSGLHCPLLAHV